MHHRPSQWKEKQSHVAVRLRSERQGELLSCYSAILANRDDLPLAEVVRRCRGKRGHENAFEGAQVDLDLRHPPCRGSRANGQMAHPLLRTVQFRLLPKAACPTA